MQVHDEYKGNRQRVVETNDQIVTNMDDVPNDSHIVESMKEDMDLAIDNEPDIQVQEAVHTLVIALSQRPSQQIVDLS